MTRDKVLPMTARHRQRRNRWTWLFGGAALAGALLAGVQLRAAASWADTVQTAKLKHMHMQEDAATIQKLRTSPVAAMTRTRPTESLLDQVEQALQSAQIDRARWTDSLPLPASRERDSDYRVHGTHLALKNITMRELAAFSHALTQADPALYVGALHLFNREASKPLFDAEVLVAYRVFVPKKHVSHSIRSSMHGDREELSTTYLRI